MREGHRSIPNSCCASCCSVICTASAASASWWKSYVCIWRGVGSPDWASIRRFRITPRFPRTGMVDSRNRICFRRSLRIVARCVEAGLVKGEHMSVDGSFIQANADHHSRVPREQLAEVAKVNHTVREYLVELERESPVEPPVAQQEKVSTTDPDSTYATKGGPARLGYYDNYLVDNASCVIVGVQATPARLSQESAAARDMIERYRERYGYLPQTLAADTTYGNGELLQWLDDRGIAAYIRG